MIVLEAKNLKKMDVGGLSGTQPFRYRFFRLNTFQVQALPGRSFKGADPHWYSTYPFRYITFQVFALSGKETLSGACVAFRKGLFILIEAPFGIQPFR